EDYFPITNPNFHYESINVESEMRLQTSLLHWVRKMIRVRQKFAKVFGRGDITFLEHNNRKVLSYIRSYEGVNMLCIFNLSRKPTYLELTLGNFSGYTPVEIITGVPFPKIGQLPYFFTLHPRSFFWLNLEQREEGAGS
ncbi:MAG: alpha-glucosidase C-terminal domain-containing protein, partial [Candidatus Thermoplasmatota archaeon]|nr:alpha-glucosidase C-terminal domain-containing protein [Candidatus Thermoplasmatota archaeon]